MSTRTYFVLARDTTSPYLSESGRSFGELGKRNCRGEKPIEFLSVNEVVRYLRMHDNVPDVTKIVRVVETVPVPAVTFEETVVV